jgi:chromate transporter
LTSFGGPVAHLGYFRREFVDRRRWLDDVAYTDLLALCQFLPGPASSQVGFSIGLMRAGWLGGLAAWCGFTLPSVLLMVAFATAAPSLGSRMGVGLVHGLKLTAVAIVAQAVWEMGRRLCPDRTRAAIALGAVALLSLLATVYAQLIVIALGAVIGISVCRGDVSQRRPEPFDPIVAAAPVSRSASIAALVLFCLLLFGVPVAAGLTHASHFHGLDESLQLFDAFYRSGALVFGGGHVVLPLLQHQSAIVDAVSPNAFLSGYGAAQAVPGPLFSFAAFLGWTMTAVPYGLAGAALATAAIFLPGLLLVVAALPHWQSLRARPSTAALFAGVNAAVVGLLATALYSPVWTSAVHAPIDFAIAAIGFGMLVRWNTPPLAVVAFCAIAGVAQFALR